MAVQEDSHSCMLIVYRFLCVSTLFDMHLFIRLWCVNLPISCRISCRVGLPNVDLRQSEPESRGPPPAFIHQSTSPPLFSTCRTTISYVYVRQFFPLLVSVIYFHYIKLNVYLVAILIGVGFAVVKLIKMYVFIQFRIGFMIYSLKPVRMM